MHERPGVYSSYDASTVVSAGRAAKVIGVAAKAVKGTAGEVVTLTGYAAGVAAFGEDAADTPGMSTILRLLFANGASTVAAVRVAEAGAVKDYQDAFAALGGEEARILVCDSAEETVQQALRTAVEDASAARMERIAVVGGDGESAAELVTHAAALNSERMVLVGPDALDSGGKTLPGVFAAAALAGVIASGRDPGVPLNGAEIRGLGGESGSGKSVTAMSVAGLLPRKQCDFSGEILLDGAELLHADRTLLRQVQGREIGVVFQEPQSCMDPLMRIGPQVEEVLRIHTDLSREARRDQALAALAAVELPDPAGVYRKYPHELSGGMLQRAMIAAAVVARPKLLLLDEPTTALDVTIQAQILELLKKLNRESGISMLFISHNLNVVRKLCTRTAVMQRGVLVEEGDIETVFRHPRHPYTQRLIAAIPTRHRKEETP